MKRSEIAGTNTSNNSCLLVLQDFGPVCLKMRTAVHCLTSQAFSSSGAPSRGVRFSTVFSSCILRHLDSFPFPLSLINLPFHFSVHHRGACIAGLAFTDTVKLMMFALRAPIPFTPSPTPSHPMLPVFMMKTSSDSHSTISINKMTAVCGTPIPTWVMGCREDREVREKALAWELLGLGGRRPHRAA